MSGLLSAIGKVFKAVIDSPIFKIVAIAAAVYFTGGLALAAAPEAAVGAGALEGAGIGFGASAATLESVGLGADALAGAGTFAGVAASDVAAVAGDAFLPGALGAEGAANVAGDAFLPGAMGAEGAANVAGDAFLPGSLAPGADSLGTNLAAGMDPLAGTPPVDAMNVGAPSGASIDTPPGVPGPDTLQTPADYQTGTSGMPDASIAPPSPGANQVTGVDASVSPQGPGIQPDNQMTSVADANRAGTGGLQAQLGQYGSDIGSLPGKAMDWYSNLNPAAKQIVGQGLSGIGKGALGAISQQKALEAQQKIIDQKRADVFAHSEVPTSSLVAARNNYRPGVYKASGIVNSGTGA